MVQFSVRRALRSVLTIWFVVSAVFVVLWVAGDPAQAMLPDDATPEQIASFQRRFGLDDPIPVQYVRYLSRVAQGDFGISPRDRRPVTELIQARMQATLELAGAAEPSVAQLDDGEDCRARPVRSVQQLRPPSR